MDDNKHKLTKESDQRWQSKAGRGGKFDLLIKNQDLLTPLLPTDHYNRVREYMADIRHSGPAGSLEEDNDGAITSGEDIKVMGKRKRRNKAEQATVDTADASSSKPRGRPSWARGRKLKILLENEDLFHKDHCAYYQRCTQLFVDEFGYDLPYDQLPDPDAPPQEPSMSLDSDQQEERDRREDFRKNVYHKISEWARNRWLAKKSDGPEVDKVLSAVTTLAKKKPTYKSELQYFQDRYWHTMVRPEFEKKWGVLKTFSKNQRRIAEVNRISKEVYSAQPEEFKAKLREDYQREFQREMEDFNASKENKLPETAAVYDGRWVRVAQVVPCIADGLASHYGVSVTIILAGPRASGEIEVESVTGLVPDAVCNIPLDKFDAKRYRTVHDLCGDWARTLFSPATCASRVVDNENDDSQDQPADPPSASKDTSHAHSTATSSLSTSTITVDNRPNESRGLDPAATTVTVEALPLPHNEGQESLSATSGDEKAMSLLTSQDLQHMAQGSLLTPEEMEQMVGRAAGQIGEGSLDLYFPGQQGTNDGPGPQNFEFGNGFNFSNVSTFYNNNGNSNSMNSMYYDEPQIPFNTSSFSGSSQSQYGQHMFGSGMSHLADATHVNNMSTTYPSGIEPQSGPTPLNDPTKINRASFDLATQANLLGFGHTVSAELASPKPSIIQGHPSVQEHPPGGVSAPTSDGGPGIVDRSLAGTKVNKAGARKRKPATKTSEQDTLHKRQRISEQSGLSRPARNRKSARHYIPEDGVTAKALTDQVQARKGKKQRR
ncbi:hypothetical protein VNI00_017290 [Paramarasmius palmivorus]|uniref:Uncharacterized protein n=1 Tax=Paramarasmius palmivorus TaxID=297713 RepID=A0AAW0B837_9AGAR